MDESENWGHCVGGEGFEYFGGKGRYTSLSLRPAWTPYLVKINTSILQEAKTAKDYTI